MMSMFVFGLIGGLAAAWLALPYGWLAACGAYAIGGAVCAAIPALFEWRREVVRERTAAALAPRITFIDPCRPTGRASRLEKPDVTR